LPWYAGAIQSALLWNIHFGERTNRILADWLLTALVARDGLRHGILPRVLFCCVYKVALDSMKTSQQEFTGTIRPLEQTEQGWL
ncbi:MAG TPA: hypothetical protein VE866_18340, partial [Candidatus Binatia bacterium]|nr:hypothetical protein [Candidatus Binatia bacterium]